MSARVSGHDIETLLFALSGDNHREVMNRAINQVVEISRTLDRPGQLALAKRLQGVALYRKNRGWSHSSTLYAAARTIKGLKHETARTTEV